MCHVCHKFRQRHKSDRPRDLIQQHARQTAGIKAGCQNPLCLRPEISEEDAKSQGWSGFGDARRYGQLKHKQGWKPVVPVGKNGCRNENCLRPEDPNYTFYKLGERGSVVVATTTSGHKGEEWKPVVQIGKTGCKNPKCLRGEDYGGALTFTWRQQTVFPLSGASTDVPAGLARQALARVRASR
jgi:hypothetical protein